MCLLVVGGCGCAREGRFLRDTCRNYLTKWLCGTGDECMDSSSRPALLQALRHLHEDFAAVGVLEMLPESIAVMSSLLPEHFPQPPQPPRAAPNASSAAAGRLPRPQSLPHKHRATYPEPSAMAVDIITAWNANDLVLYVRTRRCVPGTMRGAGAGHRTGLTTCALCGGDRYQEARRLLSAQFRACGQV